MDFISSGSLLDFIWMRVNLSLRTDSISSYLRRHPCSYYVGDPCSYHVAVHHVNQLASFSLYIVILLLTRGMKDASDYLDERTTRFVLTLPIVRLFGLNKRTRHLVFTMAKVLPQFYSLLTLLFLVVYVYARYGVYLFSNRLELVLQDDTGHLTFDNMSSAMLILFQMLTGDSLSEVMCTLLLSQSICRCMHLSDGVVVIVPVIRATGWAAAVYFISFIAVRHMHLISRYCCVCSSTFLYVCHSSCHYYL